jgi:hypothetical protein
VSIEQIPEETIPLPVEPKTEKSSSKKRSRPESEDEPPTTRRLRQKKADISYKEVDMKIPGVDDEQESEEENSAESDPEELLKPGGTFTKADFDANAVDDKFKSVETWGFDPCVACAKAKPPKYCMVQCIDTVVPVWISACSHCRKAGRKCSLSTGRGRPKQQEKTSPPKKTALIIESPSPSQENPGPEYENQEDGKEEQKKKGKGKEEQKKKEKEKEEKAASSPKKSPRKGTDFMYFFIPLV